MYIIIGILAGIIILQSIIIWKYQRQVKDICRQLAFLMKHDSNMLIHREFGLGGIGMLSDRLNDLLELRRKEKRYYQVQVGAYRERPRAEFLVRELAARGFPAFLVYDDGLYKVRVGAFLQMDNGVRMEQRVRQAGYPTMLVREEEV